MSFSAYESSNSKVGRAVDPDADDSIEFMEFAPAETSTEADQDAALHGLHFAEVDPSTMQSVDAASAPVQDVAPAWFRKRRQDSDSLAVSTDDAAAREVSVEARADRIAQPAPTKAESKKSRRKSQRARDVMAEADAAGMALANSNGSLLQTDEEEDAEPLHWKARVLLLITSVAASSYGMSLLVHSVALLGLSLIVYSNLDDNTAPALIITEDNSLNEDLVEIADFSFKSSGGAPETQLPTLPPVPSVDPLDALSGDVASVTTAVAGEGDGETSNEGFGFMFQMPAGGKAVTKGSFAVWTVPEDPRPNQDYKIVIRIKLPENSKLRTYRVADLTGQVIGTDGFRLEIPYDRNRPNQSKSERGDRLVPIKPSDRLRVIDSHVQIVVDIPAASSLVRDTIHVESRMLDEEQDIEIVF